METTQSRSVPALMNRRASIFRCVSAAEGVGGLGPIEVQTWIRYWGYR